MFATGNAPSSQRLDVGLAVLRLALGIVFIAHGSQKLFIYGFDGLTESFAGMGIPFAGILAPAVALAEFFGGIALVVGLFTRVSATVLAATMVGAVTIVHLPAGFFLPNGYEFAFSLLGGAAALALMGAGSYSADTVLARRRGTGTGTGTSANRHS